MRDAAYSASVDLAQERGAFPLFNADLYLRRGSFASRLPAALKERIRAQGLRNSHLLSIAPTGTISLAFADNASNGIEPPFSWTYTRKKREPDGSFKQYDVEDHAWRLYRHLAGPDAALPESFVTALEMSAEAHEAMVAAVAPYIDTSISKTVNVPEDYPYEDFQDLYLQAWRSGLKGLATYRPNNVLGSVLSVTPTAPSPAAAPALTADGANERLQVDKLPAPVLASLRWPGRPEMPGGNPAWSYMATSRCSSANCRPKPGRAPACSAVRCRSRCGSTAPSSRAAWARWPRRCRWTCGSTMPNGSSSSSMRWPRWPRSARSRCRSRPAARHGCSPAWWRPPRR
jgi:ribonucleoside-diphosphate reductase alpha chain